MLILARFTNPALNVTVLENVLTWMPSLCTAIVLTVGTLIMIDTRLRNSSLSIPNSFLCLRVSPMACSYDSILTALPSVARDLALTIPSAIMRMIGLVPLLSLAGNKGDFVPAEEA